MRVHSLLVAGLLAAAAPAAHAADDLMEIYRAARDNDPVFQQAIADRRAREEALPQARAGILPEVNATSSFDRVEADTEADDARLGQGFDGGYNRLTYGVELRQPLYRESAFRSIDRADATVAQAQSDFAAARQELMLRVVEAYFSVLDARVALQAAEAEKKAIGRQLEQARQRFEVGVIARTDVEEAKARYDVASASVIEAENDVRSARARLREITGMEPDQLAQVVEGVELERPQPADEQAWRARAEERSHRIAAAQRAAEAAMASIGVARGGHYPQLDAVASYGHQDTSDGAQGGIESDEFTVGVQLTIPLYSGGGTSSRVREAQYRYTEARETLEEARRNVTRAAADAYRGVETALQRVRALDQARDSTSAALDATEAGFEVGTRTIVDVLNAQREVFNAERNYQQARHAYLVNTLRLQRAVGTLSPEGLAEVNALLATGEQAANGGSQ